MNSSLSFALSNYDNFINDLGALVNVDCGTHNKAGVDWVGHWLRDRCLSWGWTVDRIPQEIYGDCWVAHLHGTGKGRLMLVGHLDTVYPDGTAAARPMRFEGNTILGPGVCDMKGGLLTGLYAMRALQQNGFTDFEELIYFFDSDEEIGSIVSRDAYSAVAKTVDAALVFESARANGDIVSARKGSAEYKLTVYGKSAHAGVEPHKGANAVLELAHQIPAIRKLDGIKPGVTVNPDVISGGTKSNVIADEAWVLVDVRATDPEGAATVQQAFDSWPTATTVPGTRVEVSGGFGFMPMAKTPAITAMVQQALEAAHDLNIPLKDAATGGASDANLIASIGVPVLDGLGPIGGLDHSPDEYIEADSIAPRLALATEIIKRVLTNKDMLKAG